MGSNSPPSKQQQSSFLGNGRRIGVTPQWPLTAKGRGRGIAWGNVISCTDGIGGLGMPGHGLLEVNGARREQLNCWLGMQGLLGGVNWRVE